jgi:hypothetical protein
MTVTTTTVLTEIACNGWKKKGARAHITRVIDKSVNDVSRQIGKSDGAVSIASEQCLAIRCEK